MTDETLEQVVHRVIREYLKGCSIGAAGECEACAHAALTAIAHAAGMSAKEIDYLKPST